MEAQEIVAGLLSQAGISINGKQPWDIQVHDERFYRRVLSETELGLGESYMDGWWDCEALDEFINKILRARLDKAVRGDWRTALYVLQTRLLNRQNRARAQQVGE